MCQVLNHKFKTLPIDCVFEILSYDKRFVLRNGHFMTRIPREDPRYRQISIAIFSYWDGDDKGPYTNIYTARYENGSFITTLKLESEDTFLYYNYYYLIRRTNELSKLFEGIMISIYAPQTIVVRAIQLCGYRGWSFEKKIAEKKEEIPQLWDLLYSYCKNKYRIDDILDKYIFCVLHNIINFHQDDGLYTVLHKMKYNQTPFL